MTATEFIGKAKTFVKDNALAVGAVVAVAAIGAAYFVFVRPKKTCPTCQGWNMTIDEKCRYCGRVL